MRLKRLVDSIVIEGLQTVEGDCLTFRFDLFQDIDSKDHTVVVYRLDTYRMLLLPGQEMEFADEEVWVRDYGLKVRWTDYVGPDVQFSKFVADTLIGLGFRQ